VVTYRFKATGTCRGDSLWDPILDRSCSHYLSIGRLRNNPPEDIRLLQVWGLSP